MEIRTLWTLFRKHVDIRSPEEKGKVPVIFGKPRSPQVVEICELGFYAVTIGRPTDIGILACQHVDTGMGLNVYVW